MREASKKVVPALMRGEVGISAESIGGNSTEGKENV